MAHELTSSCTCPPGAKARNVTGHSTDCPCYAEWYNRYAPKDAGEYIQPAPDQLGPVELARMEGLLGENFVHRGADWVIQHDTAITLASIKAEAQQDGKDGE